jgi:hypothetical protein
MLSKSTYPLGFVHLMHVRSECGRARAEGDANAIVIEVRISSARLVVASKIPRSIAPEINLVDQR